MTGDGGLLRRMSALAMGPGAAYPPRRRHRMIVMRHSIRTDYMAVPHWTQVSQPWVVTEERRYGR